MKETPLICKPELVKQIIDDNKTHTRRIIKDVWEVMPARAGDPLSAYRFEFTKGSTTNGNPVKIKCPYGKPGDLLWVRETWATSRLFDLMAPRDIPVNVDILYLADGADNWNNCAKVRPSIFMPRWASRLTLEIEEIRVERIQDISTVDIIKEGLSTTLREHEAVCDLQDQFTDLWDSINKKRGYGWNANPYVWVVVFKKYDKGLS